MRRVTSSSTSSLRKTSVRYWVWSLHPRFGLGCHSQPVPNSRPPSMRSRSRAISIYKSPKLGVTPGLILLAQRHLEKEAPEPLTGGSYGATYTVPVDLLGMATGRNDVSDISRIELTYRK